VITVPPYRETALRRIADTPTLKMMDLWKMETRRALGQSIEIMVDNRRNGSAFQSFQGQVNTAIPEKYGDELVLKLWLENFPNPNMIILTHEIGHWVLKLQGYQNLACKPADQFGRGPLLNDVAVHIPLYALQRSIGLNPQTEIDLRTDHDILLCSEAQGEAVDDKTSALLLADDIQNCSKAKCDQLRTALKQNLPAVLRLIEEIVSAAGGHDLMNPQQSLAFRYRVVERLELEGNSTQATNSRYASPNGKRSNTSSDTPTPSRRKPCTHS
jgi:hypothetical protein